MYQVLAVAILLCCNNTALYYSQWHSMYWIRRIKNLATCFSYESSWGQRQN